MAPENPPQITEFAFGEPLPSNPKRVEKRLLIHICPEILAAHPEMGAVVEAMREIKLIEHDSGQPGDLVFVTNGVHGEETKEEDFLVVSFLDRDLSSRGTSIQSGTVVLIPNLNAPGCRAKTRYVFTDERDTSLNDVFGCFKSGEWDEFLLLSTKTEMYAWLLMKYFSEKRDQHLAKYGPGHEILLFDIHAEEIAIPHIRIDRMYENPIILEQLETVVDDIQIPRALEYKEWADMRYAQSLAATAVAQQILSVTIEEGSTKRPDEFLRRYVAAQVLLRMHRRGMITGLENRFAGFEDLFIKHPTPAVKRAQAIWRQQHDSPLVFYIEDVLPTLINQDGKELSPREFICEAVIKGMWNGCVQARYAPALRGTQGGTDIPIANLTFLGLSRENQPADVLLVVTNFSDTSWILSVPEPSGAMLQRTLYYAFFLIKEGEKQIVTLDIVGEGKGVQLRPEQLGNLIESLDVTLDLSVLGVTCIVPDTSWGKGRVNGAIRLVPGNATE